MTKGLKICALVRSMNKLVNDALIVVASPFSDIIECSGKTFCQCRSHRLLIAVLNPAIIYLQIISSDYDTSEV